MVLEAMVVVEVLVVMLEVMKVVVAVATILEVMEAVMVAVKRRWWQSGGGPGGRAVG